MTRSIKEFLNYKQNLYFTSAVFVLLFTTPFILFYSRLQNSTNINRACPITHHELSP